MVRQLYRYNLDFKKSMDYIADNLQGTNTLSSELLNTVSFESGCFFTLLPEGSNIERIHEFEVGVVLPQNPELHYDSQETKSTYSFIPTIDDELAQLIHKKLEKYKTFTCVFDDAMRDTDDTCLNFFSQKSMLYCYNIEAYYILNYSNASIETTLKCIETSNIVWHFLCLITNYDFNDTKEHKLTPDAIKEACLKIKELIIGAYDREGYIFWEKNI